MLRDKSGSWGVREYRFATNALREGRFMRLFMLVTGVCCIGLAGLLAVAQWHPAGPSGLVARGVQVLAAGSAVAVGVRWLRGPWPSFPQAILFLVWADIAAATGAVTMATPAAQLSATPYMGIVGVFAGFILGARILLLHCIFAGGVIACISIRAVAVEQYSAFDLSIYFMPAVVWVVAVPLVGSALIELGRRAIVRTARAAHYDPLTGLRNRRGMHVSVGRLVARSPRSVVAMAVCDIDRFKQLNDDGGHALGDAALVALAAKLRAVARADELTARIGGDELVLVSFLDDVTRISDLADRVSELTTVQAGDADFTVSIGIATMSTAASHFTVDAVVRHADAAMYEAKRSGGATCAVHGCDSATGPA